MKPNSHLIAQSQPWSQIKAFFTASPAFKVTYPEYVLSCYPESHECIHDTPLRTPSSMMVQACVVHWHVFAFVSHEWYKRLGYLLSLFGWFLRSKDEKLIQVKTRWACKTLTFSELTEQELKHNQESRWRCSPPCTVLHTGQTYEGARKRVSQKLQCSLRCWDSLSSSSSDGC